LEGSWLRFLTSLEEKLSDTANAEAVVRRFGVAADLYGVFVDDFFICLCITLSIIYIPAEGFKEGVDEFYAELGFVVGRVSIGFDILLEALNEAGYLFQGFFHFFTPTLTLPHQRGREKWVQKISANF